MTDDEKLLAALTGFTEGPWWRDPDSNEIYGGSCNVVVAYSSGLQFKSDGPLIAAAPDLFRIATEQAVENKRLCRNLAQVVDALGMALNVYDGAGLASAEPVEATDAIDYCRMLFKFHNKAGKP